MSIISAKSNLTSILKAYSPSERNKVKNAVINKVRFDMPKRKGLLEAVEAVTECDDYQPLHRFIEFLRETEICDAEFLEIYQAARKVVHELSPKFTNLVEALLSLTWTKRGPEAVQAYADFCKDVMVAHSKYVQYGLEQLIMNWIPEEGDKAEWVNGTISEKQHNELEIVHKLIDGILTAIPMSFNILLDTIETKFPYFKKDTHIVAGYLHNVLWLIEYKPMIIDKALQLIIRKLLILDVNAPRSEIEEYEDDEEEDEDAEGGTGDRIDDKANAQQNIPHEGTGNQDMDDALMEHPVARTLDICMEKLYSYLEQRNPFSKDNLNLSEEEKLKKFNESLKFFKHLLDAFDIVILPSHNTHHVQFLIFYFCTFKQTFMETFLSNLWQKIRNPNLSAVIRQAAVGYLASFLARSKVTTSVLQRYLKDLSDWAHQYILRSDQYRSNGSLKANIVFFSVCQAIFYLISFRSHDLTKNKKGILFLQTLQLPALVSCHLNPLRVCLPAVATAFAGVTRAYQLAYCHAILERNARRKLATVYANDTATPEEVLETFFPFDPYLLKISGRRIAPHYLQYQANEVDDVHLTPNTAEDVMKLRRRKRGDSEIIFEDGEVDDFLVADKKRQRISHDWIKNKLSYGLNANP